jgi:hypothetical protein
MSIAGEFLAAKEREGHKEFPENLTADSADGADKYFYP